MIKNDSKKKVKKKKKIVLSPVRVCVRLKPSLVKSKQIQHSVKKIHVIPDVLEYPSGSNSSKSFEFDRVFAPNATQFDVLKYVKDRVIKNSLEGSMNVTFVAYGSICSGKTYSLFGKLQKKRKKKKKKKRKYIQGVVQLLGKKIFEKISEVCFKSRGRVQYRVGVSMYEIYNDKVTDLLISKRNAKYRNVYEMKESGMKKKKHLFENVSVRCVKTENKFKNLIEIGNDRRTKINLENSECSSGGHVFLKIFFSKFVKPKGSPCFRGKGITKVTFVDLAGRSFLSSNSNNVISKGNRGVMKLPIYLSVGDNLARERVSNNLSYTFISQLVKNLKRKKPYVNYRNTILTRVLKEFFSGDSKTFVLATVDTSPKCLKDSLLTLHLASQFCGLKTRVKKHGDDEEVFVLIGELALELEKVVTALEKVFVEKELRVKREVEKYENVSKKEMEKIVEHKEKEFNKKEDMHNKQVKFLKDTVGSLHSWKLYGEGRILEEKENVSEIKNRIMDFRNKHLQKLCQESLENDKRLLEIHKRVEIYEKLLEKTKIDVGQNVVLNLKNEVTKFELLVKEKEKTVLFIEKMERLI